jgi:hypothetical protein
MRLKLLLVVHLEELHHLILSRLTFLFRVPPCSMKDSDETSTVEGGFEEASLSVRGDAASLLEISTMAVVTGF